MGLSLVTGPTEEPVSLIEAKQHCRIDSTDDDGLIAGYIIAARMMAEGDTRRAFITQTWDYTINYGWPLSNGSQRIELPLGKLQSITSISYVDTAGATQVLASNQYTVITSETGGLIVPAYNVSWPDVRWQVGNITVRMVVGWLAHEFPSDLRQAMMMLISHWYESRESVSAIGQPQSVVPMATESILSSYRISRIL